MTERDPEGRAGGGGGNPAEADGLERGPTGTLFLLMVYVILLAGMWGAMYWILVSR